MAKLFVRIAGALGITALALFFVSVIPFFADPIVGAGFAAKPPSFSVNREFKGDRLPASSIAPVASRSRPQNGPNTRDLGAPRSWRAGPSAKATQNSSWVRGGLLANFLAATGSYCRPLHDVIELTSICLI